MNAAKIEFADGTDKLGYVVAFRAENGEVGRPPAAAVWQPITRQCELALMRPGQRVEWVSCNAIVEVSRPNRMHAGTQLRLALARTVPGLVGQ